MGDRNKVHDEHQVVNSIKELVRDLVPPIRSPSNNQKGSQDSVASDHNLGCEFVTKCLIAVGAKKAKESEEKERCEEDYDDHGVAKVDVHAKGSIERDDPVNK